MNKATEFFGKFQSAPHFSSEANELIGRDYLPVGGVSIRASLQQRGERRVFFGVSGFHGVSIRASLQQRGEQPIGR